MPITIDIESPEPLYAQLVDQIKTAVQTGELQAGEPLPSIRQLATDLELNNKTVAKAFRLLERDTIIQTRGYRGTFIHPDALANCAIDLGQWVTGQISEMVAKFRRAGVTDSEIRIAFGNVMNERNL